MTFSQRLKELRKREKITQEQLAQIIGVERSSIGKYETGTIPSIEILTRIAKYFNVSTDLLLGNERKTDYTRYGLSTISKKRLPMLGEIACGEPIFANEEREYYVEAGTELKADFTLRAKGDSMIGAGIVDGAIVFVRQQDMVENGEVAAVIIEDSATLKRVFYYPAENRLILNADNPAYPPLVYSGEELDHIKILGKAIAYQADIK